MFPDYDFTRLLMVILLAGAAIGGALVTLVFVAWPWLWALSKPLLHAWTA